MGYLRSIEVVGGSITPLYTFSKFNTAGDRPFARRVETIEIAGADYGNAPTRVAPVSAYDWSYGFRIFTAGKPDLAFDALKAACGNGDPVWLVWAHDGGYERVVTGELKGIRWPQEHSDVYVDATATFTIREHLHERALANQAVVGVGVPITVGTVAPGSNYTLNNSSVALPTTAATLLPTGTADASLAGTGGVPIMDDTTLRIILYGPYGGAEVMQPDGTVIDGGFSIVNTSVTIPDEGGNPVNPQLTVRHTLTGTGIDDFMVIDCGAKTIVTSGLGNIEDRRVRYRYQPYWFVIKAGIVNQLLISPAGASPVAGGKVDIQWRRYF